MGFFTPAPELYCTNCGACIDETKTITPGNIGIELLLWLCFIMPGVIYSVWRVSARYEACPYCESPDLIPVDSPRAKQLLAKNN